jgi:acetate kinase
MLNYIVVINAGSSSIKFAVYQVESLDELVEVLNGQVDGIGHIPHLKITRAKGEVLVDSELNDYVTRDYKSCLNIIYSWLMEYVDGGKLLAVGHRVVHGGISYAAPVLVNDTVLSDLEGLIPLAPLHQPHNLLAIRAFQKIMPTMPQIACFDTSFHRTQPEVAQYFGLPRRFYKEGIRRYGFHGLSYEYIASVLPSFGLKSSDERIIVAHLGSGASLCAMQNGASVATTMGFSPLDGLVMGTRCGSLDPGVMIYLMDHYGMGARELEHLLYHDSGLLGISGISNDMRSLLECNDPLAREAIALFVYRIGREIGSLAAALGGLDTLIFTGGIGENSAVVRTLVCKQAKWLGLELEQGANEISAKCISTLNSKIAAFVIKTNENLMIAQHTQKQILF